MVHRFLYPSFTFPDVSQTSAPSVYQNQMDLVLLAAYSRLALGVEAVTKLLTGEWRNPQDCGLWPAIPDGLGGTLACRMDDQSEQGGFQCCPVCPGHLDPLWAFRSLSTCMSTSLTRHTICPGLPGCTWSCFSSILFIFNPDASVMRCWLCALLSLRM